MQSATLMATGLHLSIYSWHGQYQQFDKLVCGTMYHVLSSNNQHPTLNLNSMYELQIQYMNFKLDMFKSNEDVHFKYNYEDQISVYF